MPVLALSSYGVFELIRRAQRGEKFRRFVAEQRIRDIRQFFSGSAIVILQNPTRITCFDVVPKSDRLIGDYYISERNCEIGHDELSKIVRSLVDPRETDFGALSDWPEPTAGLRIGAADTQELYLFYTVNGAAPGGVPHADIWYCVTENGAVVEPTVGWGCVFSNRAGKLP